MPHIDNIRQFRGGGMNLDDAPEDIVQPDYIIAYNARNTGTNQGEKGLITNPENTQLITQSLPAGICKGIGGGSFEDVGLSVFFRYSSAGFNQILIYNKVTKTEQVIYEDSTDSAGAILLPLNPQNYIKAILVNQTYLIWVGRNLEVGYTNLNTLASGGYGTVLAEDLSLLKPQCPIPPTGTYGSDLGQPANFLYGKLPQFTIQYINADFNYSAWSTRSKRIVPYQQNTPVLGSNVGQNNYIIVSVNIGSIRVVTTNIACQFDNSGLFSIIKSVDSTYAKALPNTAVNVAMEIYEAYDPTTNLYSFAFYNNTVTQPVAPTETDLGYDYIWPANTLENINGNIVALADLSVGYPRPVSPVILTAIGYNPNIGIPANVLPDRLTNAGSSPGSSGSGDGDHRRTISISLSGTPHTGDTIVIVAADIRDANNTKPYGPYTVPSGQDGNLAAVAASIAEIVGGSFVDNSGVYTITWIGDPFFGLSIFSVELFFAGAQVANSIPTIIENTTYQLAKAHFDNKQRYFPLETDSTYILSIPSKAQVNGNAIYIGWQLTNIDAPEGAVGFQWLITKAPIDKILDVTAVLLNYKGTWDASTNTVSGGGSLSVNSGNIGDTYQITTPADPAFPTTYHNLGDGSAYPTGAYVTNVGGSDGGAGAGQSYAVLPKNFGNLATTGSNGILAFSLNALALLNADYGDIGVNTNLVYDFTEGDRCTLHSWIGSAGAINTFSTAPGTGYTDGTYTGVALTGGSGSGAVATVVVSGGAVTSVTLTSPGIGYTIGDVLTGTVPAGTGWSITVGTLVINGVNYFNNPCIDLAVLGYDVANNIVKVENSAALTFSSGHVLYNGQQIDARNIFIRLYSPAPQTQTASTNLNETVWFEIGERFTITNGIYDTLSGKIFDGGGYYKTRQFPDAIQPYSNAPVEVLATDLNYSDFYTSPYYSFGRPRTYNDELEQTERKAIAITGQPYILGSKRNGLTRFYPADVYGETDGQTSSSFGAIQDLRQRGDILLIIQELNIFYAPVNITYIQLKPELAQEAISDKLLNNGRYETKGIGLGLAKEAHCFNENVDWIIDPHRSEPFEVTTGGVNSISNKMSKYFKQVFALAYSQGKKIVLFYNRYYNELMVCIEADGGILTLFPFDTDTWNPFNNFVITPGDVSATPNGSHSTASYNGTTGKVTYTPTTDYVGNDVATFTFNPGSGAITLNVCLNWTAGNSTIDPFSFAAKINQPLSTPIMSNTILVSGNNIPVAISITGDTGLGYSVNGGAFTSSPGMVNPGDVVQVQVTSSASNSTLTSCTLTIGATSATFDVTTFASGGSTTPMSILSDTITGGVETSFDIGTMLSFDTIIDYSITYRDGGVDFFLGGNTVIIPAGSITIFGTLPFVGDMSGWTSVTTTVVSVSPNPNGGIMIIYVSPQTDVV